MTHDHYSPTRPFSPFTHCVNANVPQGDIPRPPRRTYALGGGVPPRLGGRRTPRRAEHLRRSPSAQGCRSPPRGATAHAGAAPLRPSQSQICPPLLLSPLLTTSSLPGFFGPPVSLRVVLAREEKAGDGRRRRRRRQGQARRKRRKGGSRGEGEAGAALGTEERQGASGRRTEGKEGRR